MIKRRNDGQDLQVVNTAGVKKDLSMAIPPKSAYPNGSAGYHTNAMASTYHDKHFTETVKTGNENQYPLSEEQYAATHTQNDG